MPNASEEPKAVEPPSPDDGGAGGVNGRIVEMKEVVADIQKARSAGRLVRFLVLLLILLVILGAGLRAYGMYARVANNWQQYETAVIKNMRTQVLPEARDEMIAVSRAVAPVYVKAMRADWNKNRSVILKDLEKQSRLLRKNAARNLEADFQKALEGLVKRYETQMADAFPKLKDERLRDRVMDRLRDALVHSTAELVQKNMMETLALIGEIHQESIRFIPNPDLRRRMMEATEVMFQAPKAKKK